MLKWLPGTGAEFDVQGQGHTNRFVNKRFASIRSVVDGNYYLSTLIM